MSSNKCEDSWAPSSRPPPSARWTLRRRPPAGRTAGRERARLGAAPGAPPSLRPPLPSARLPSPSQPLSLTRAPTPEGRGESEKLSRGDPGLGRGFFFFFFRGILRMLGVGGSGSRSYTFRQKLAPEHSWKVWCCPEAPAESRQAPAIASGRGFDPRAPCPPRTVGRRAWGPAQVPGWGWWETVRWFWEVAEPRPERGRTRVRVPPGRFQEAQRPKRRRGPGAHE